MYASSYSRAILVKGESWAAEVNSYLRKHNMEKYLDKIANRVDDWWIRAEILVKDFFREYRYIILASVGIIVAVFSLYFTQELHSSSANNIQM